jgi:hypothetical protein
MRYRTPRFALAAAAAALLVGGCSEHPTQPAPLLEPGAPVFDMHEADVLPANVIDLTFEDAQSPVSDGVWVEQNIFEGSTGTGVFQSFVRLNSNATEVQGFNTSGRPLKNDEMASANFTRDLLLSQVPLQSLTGQDNPIYREFRADINQTAGGTFLSLDEIQVFISKTPGANPNLPLAGGSFGTCSALVWEMPEENWIALNYLLAPGSGNGDMRLLIPDQLFTDAMVGCGAEGPWYVYLYSRFGGEGGIWGQDNGFEEWSVRRAVSAPEAFKTANGTFDRDWTWTLDKSVDVDAWDLFVGDEATSTYDVTVDATSADTNFRVQGQASLLNAGGAGLRVGSRTDQIGYVDPNDLDGPMTVVATPTLVCDTSVLVNPGGNTLPAGATLACEYDYTFPSAPADPPAGMVWANRVTFNTGTGANAVAYSFTTEFQFLLAEETDRTITVTDDFDDEGPEFLFSRDAELDALPYTFSYTRTFACEDAEDGGTFNNTAEIEETGQTASASVTVTCHELEVEKDANTSFRWDWSVDKVEDDDRTELTLYWGESWELNYTVTASASAIDHAVAGTITVTNPAPIDALLNSIADVISREGDADIPGLVSCLIEVDGNGEPDYEEATFPYLLAAGETLSCTYSAELPDGEDRLNTVTVEQQNYTYAFDPEGGEGGEGEDPPGEITSAASGTTDYDAEADVTFDGVIGDENCVEVWDDKTDPENPVFLGYVCAQEDESNPEDAKLLDEEGEAFFSYPLTVGAGYDGEVDIDLDCGDTQLTNLAALLALGWEEGDDPLDTATWTVDVTIFCPEPDDETAWAANGGMPLVLAYNPDGGGNWATYVDYGDDGAEGRTAENGGFTVTMFAGQTTPVGTATFSSVTNGEIEITISLTGGWVFSASTTEALKIQDYDEAPSGNPSPGQFDRKFNATGNSITVTVPANNFYGVHADVTGGTP